MARPFYEKHGCTVFTTLKKANGYIGYSLVKHPDRDTTAMSFTRIIEAKIRDGASGPMGFGGAAASLRHVFL